MTPTPRPAATLVLTVPVLLALLLALLPGSAAAVGAQGVDLQPLLPRQGGLLTGTVDPDAPIRFRLVNSSDEPRTVSVTPSIATTDAAGAYGLAGPAPWVTLDTPGSAVGSLTLDPDQTIELAATVDVATWRDLQAPLIALVLEVEGGGNVVTQAATVIRLVDGGTRLPVPLGLLLLAGVVLLVAVTAYIRVSRQVTGSVVPGRISPAAAQ